MNKPSVFTRCACRRLPTPGFSVTPSSGGAGVDMSIKGCDRNVITNYSDVTQGGIQLSLYPRWSPGKILAQVGFQNKCLPVLFLLQILRNLRKIRFYIFFLIGSINGQKELFNTLLLKHSSYNTYVLRY